MDTEKYKLKVMPRAAVDLDSICTYISGELAAPAAAHKPMQKIEDSFMRLREYPEICPICQDGILQQKGYRKLVINNYVALSTVDNIAKSVTVIRVVHGRQEYSRFIKHGVKPRPSGLWI